MLIDLMVVFSWGGVENNEFFPTVGVLVNSGRNCDGLFVYTIPF